MKFGKAAIIALLVACVFGLAWIFTGREAPAAVVGNANVIGALASVLAVALTVVLLWSRVGARGAGSDGVTAEQVQAAVEYLAVETLRYWQLQAKDRRITTPSPAMVSWKWASEDVAAPAELRPELLTEGVVTRLREQLFDRLDAPARVVVLGGPGAGKTTAMLLLLIDILEHRRADAGQPVPVWLTLGGWNPQTTGLLEWAATVLKRDYPGLSATVHGGPAAAAELIRTGRVALFLDGLDEIPPAVQGRALELIDRDAVGLRVVVTSRPAEYQAAIEEGRLYRAAVIDVLPVKPEHARDFLLAEQVGDRRRLWQQVTNHLEAHPDSVAARTLTSPLALSLARDAYARADPRDLLDTNAYPTPDALLRHLLAQSLHLAYPNPAERDHATLWLSWIARHMGTSRDLRWWDIPTWVPTAQRQAVWGLVMGLGSGVTVGIPGALVNGPASGLMGGFVVGFAVGAAHARARRRPRDLTPQALSVRWPNWAESKILTCVLLGGIIFGIGTSFATDPAREGAPWLTLAPAFGIAFGVMFLTGTWRKSLHVTQTTRPLEINQSDRRRTSVVGPTIGFSTGLAVGLPVEIALTDWHLNRLATALPFGLAFGITIGITAGSGPAFELIVAELVLRLRGRRVRFMQLLETALKRQVLRQAGAVYQFRHAALQDLLSSFQPAVPAARQPEPLPAHPIGPADPSDRREQAEEAGPRSAG